MTFLTYLHHVALGISDYGWHILLASTTFSLCELGFGRNRYSLRSRVRAALFWLVYITITVSFFTAFNTLWGRLGLKPLLLIHLDWMTASSSMALRVLGWIAAPVTALIVNEFFYYWFHRAQHTLPLLWRFHAVHHSLREMSAWNNNHHFTEEILRIPFIALPLTLLINVNPGYTPVLVALVLGMQSQFEHSHCRLHLGPLRYLIGDPRFHRIHHSIEPIHYNKNFGSFTTVWDTLFGTAHFPTPEEWPDTGIVDQDEPKNLTEFLLRPFRRPSWHAGVQDADTAAIMLATQAAPPRQPPPAQQASVPLAGQPGTHAGGTA